MTLRACEQCRRHFAAEPACPFCGAAAPPPVPRRFSTARLSRAAAFAGLASCYTSNPPPQYGPPPPPPPVEQQTQDPHFADPPPGVTGHSRIEGVVTDPATGQPRAGWVVMLLPSGGPTRVLARTQTDQNGHYSFIDLDAGNYLVDFGTANPRQGPIRRAAAVRGNDSTTVDMAIATPAFERVARARPRTKRRSRARPR